VAWADPVLAVGAEALEPELLLDELELPELELLELELPELLELELPELLELELPELALLIEELAGAGVVELLVSLECVDPGSAKATAPAMATPATPTPVVATRTLARARFLATTAALSLSPFMFPSVGTGAPGTLLATSEPAKSRR
jgi:hypothetical protein